jgi:hypothetical protein
MNRIRTERVREALEDLSNPYFPAWDAGPPNLIIRKSCIYATLLFFGLRCKAASEGWSAEP